MNRTVRLHARQRLFQKPGSVGPATYVTCMHMMNRQSVDHKGMPTNQFINILALMNAYKAGDACV